MLRGAFVRYYLFNEQDGQYEDLIPASQEIRVGKRLDVRGRQMKITWIGEPQIDKGDTPTQAETWWIFRPALVDHVL